MIIQEFKVGGYPWFSYIKLKNRLFIQLRLIYWAVLLSEITLAAPYIRPGDSPALGQLLYRYLDSSVYILSIYPGAQAKFFPNLNNKTRPDARLINIYLSVIIYKSVIKCANHLINKPRPDQKKTPNYGGVNFGVVVSLSDFIHYYNFACPLF